MIKTWAVRFMQLAFGSSGPLRLSEQVCRPLASWSQHALPIQSGRRATSVQLLDFLDIQPSPADQISSNTQQGHSPHRILHSIGLRAMKAYTNSTPSVRRTRSRPRWHAAEERVEARPEPMDVSSQARSARTLPQLPDLVGIGFGEPEVAIGPHPDTNWHAPAPE